MLECLQQPRADDFAAPPGERTALPDARDQSLELAPGRENLRCYSNLLSGLLRELRQRAHGLDLGRIGPPARWQRRQLRRQLCGFDQREQLRAAIGADPLWQLGDRGQLSPGTGCVQHEVA